VERDANTPAPPRTILVRRLLTLGATPGFALIGMVTMAVFFARSGQQTIVPLKGADDLGLGEGALGGIFAMMALVNLLLVVPAGSMVDRFGSKATILPSACMSAVAFVLFALAGSVPAFVGAGLVLGLGSGILGPAPPAYAAAIAPAEVRGLAM